MNIRFRVNQAEAFRRGVDSPSPSSIINVNPSDLSQEVRDLLADRLCGTDVHRLCVEVLTDTSSGCPPSKYTRKTRKRGGHIVAVSPTFESLMEAVRDDQRKLEEELAGI